MKNFKLIGGVLVVLGGVCGVQVYLMKSTDARLSALEARVAGLAPDSPDPAGVDGERHNATSGTEGATGADAGRRIAALESLMSHARHATNVAAAAGRTGLSNRHIEDLRRKLEDPAASEKDKLQALRALRKNKDLSDDVLQSALGWLQTSKDGTMRREILHQLEGATNAALRQPLLELASTSAEGKLRQQAVENLRAFAGDAGVEKRLWEIKEGDPDFKVREQADQALRKAPLTPDRAAGLQQRVSDPQVPLDERLTALRALHRGGVDVSDTAAALAEFAQTSPDVVARANIFKAVEGVQDPRLLPPLLNGLQDPSPDVRREAAQALTGFGSNPNIRQWLDYVAQSDADSRVRHEAFQSLRKLPAAPPAQR